VLLVPPSAQERVPRRQSEAQRLVDALAEESWNYFQDHGEFPPGDGSGRRRWCGALRQPTPGGEPYRVFAEDLLTAGGDASASRLSGSRDSILPEQPTGRGAGQQVHNERSFDLWESRQTGFATRVNNWESTVSTP